MRNALFDFPLRFEDLQEVVRQLEKVGKPKDRASKTLRARLLRLRRSVALELLRLGISVEQVQLAASVSWRVMEQWCERDADPPLKAWHRIALEAEVVSAARRSLDKKRRSKDDPTFRQLSEDLRLHKSEYRMVAGHACEPFTSRSSDDIDALQDKLDHWHAVPPERWTEEEFIAARMARDGSTVAASDNQPDDWLELDEELELDDDDLDYLTEGERLNE